MKKKNWIVLGIIVVAIIAALLYVHYTPFWVNLQNVVIFAIGVVAGAFGLYVYNKYFKKAEM